MATPKGGYFNAAGKRIPGTTTIISRFKESGGLIRWAWQCGMDGIDYEAERDSAATVGTMAHEMVECWILDRDWRPPADADAEAVEKAQGAFGAFLTWARQSSLKVTHTEVRMVSETYQFGGTLDAMLVNGDLCLGDWKSSNSVHRDYLIQLAAYGMLWRENHPDQPITGGYHLVRFSKTDGDFEHRHFPKLDDAERSFVLMRELYELDKKLKKRVG